MKIIKEDSKIILSSCSKGVTNRLLENLFQFLEYHINRENSFPFLQNISSDKSFTGKCLQKPGKIFVIKLE